MGIMKKIANRETISYLIFGVLTTVVSYVTYFIFDKVFEGFSLRTGIATIISWIFAVSFAYITNKIFVFQSKSFAVNVIAKEIIAFVIARLTSLLFELVFMIFTVDFLYKYLTDIKIIQWCSEMINTSYEGFYKFIAKCLANVFIVIMNYFFSKIFIFKNK